MIRHDITPAHNRFFITKFAFETFGVICGAYLSLPFCTKEPQHIINNMEGFVVAFSNIHSHRSYRMKLPHRWGLWALNSDNPQSAKKIYHVTIGLEIVYTYVLEKLATDGKTHSAELKTAFIACQLPD